MASWPGLSHCVTLVSLSHRSHLASGVQLLASTGGSVPWASPRGMLQRHCLTRHTPLPHPTLVSLSHTSHTFAPPPHNCCRYWWSSPAGCARRRLDSATMSHLSHCHTFHTVTHLSHTLTRLSQVLVVQPRGLPPAADSTCNTTSHLFHMSHLASHITHLCHTITCLSQVLVVQPRGLPPAAEGGLHL
jgi:hypothetical protein